MDHSLPESGNVLSKLRAATSEAHLQLEQIVEIERCVALPQRYHQLLQSFLGFYRPLEKSLFAMTGWQELGLETAARRKTPWIEADLSALGTTAGQISTIPDCPDLPSTNNLHHGFGCLYVLEGATLGGRQITSLMRDSPVPENARHFFNSYGAETGLRWREFIVALENRARAAKEKDRMEMIEAAQQTFACLQRWVVRSCVAHEHPD